MFMDTKQIRIDIQILRAISVIAVVGYHLKLPGFQNGFLGVDIFFLVSGFLMAQLYTRSNALNFYRRRAMRLLPAYWVTIIVSMAIATALTVSSDFSQVLEQAKASFALIPNVYFWSQDSYFSSRNFNPLLNLWSLGVEIQFYLFVPLIAWFAKRQYLIIGISFLSLVACLAILSVSPKTAFFITPFRFWEFLMGYLLYELSIRKHDWRRRLTRHSWSYLFSIALIIFLFPINTQSTAPLIGHPGISAILVTVFAGLVLITRIPMSINLLTKPLYTIGNLSYSIYLIHFPLLAFFFYKPFQGNSSGNLSAKMLVVFLATLILLSLILNKFVENKFRNSKFKVSTILISIVLISTLFPIMDAIKKGSYSANEIRISNAYFDRANYRCGKLNRIINPTASICRISRIESGKKVLLLGNSHADSIKTSFAQVAEETGITTYFWVQNDPLNGVRQSTGEISDEISRNRIDTVFLHYSVGAVKREVLEDFILKLKAVGITVVIFGPIPTWPESVPESMWLDKEKILLFQSHSDFKTLNLIALKTLSEIAEKFNLPYFDLAREFCREVCKFADAKGVPYYWDEGHLTLSGAQVLEPLFKTVIAKVYKVD